MSSRDRRRKIQDEENLLFAQPETRSIPKRPTPIGFGLGELAAEIAAADSAFSAN